MIVAAIGDIHGNLPALEAALAAVDDEGILTIVNTGDCAAGHPWPDETIALLRERRIPGVQGNQDRMLLRAERKGASKRGAETGPDAQVLIDAAARCSIDNLEYLRSLPRMLRLTVDGIEMAIAHGTLTNQNERLEADEDDTRYQRQREILPIPLFIFGGTHEPHARWVHGVLFVNPGSVGMPADGARVAHYAVISTEKEPWTVELRSVPY